MARQKAAKETYSSIHSCVSDAIYEMDEVSLCRHGLGAAIEIVVVEQTVVVAFVDSVIWLDGPSKDATR